MSLFFRTTVFCPEKFSNVIVNGPYQENIRKYGLMAVPPSNLVYPEGAGSRKFQVLFLLSSRLTAIEISNCLAPSLKQAAPPHAPRYLLFCQTLGYPGRR